MARFPNVLND